MLSTPSLTSGMDRDFKDRSLLLITCVVVALHAAFLGWAAFFHSPSPMKREAPAKRLVVQTISLNPQPVQPIVEVKEELEVAAIQEPPPPPPPVPEVIPEEVVVEPVPEPIVEVQEPPVMPPIEEPPACQPEAKPEEPKAQPSPTPKPKPAPPKEKKPPPKKPEKKKEAPKKPAPKKDLKPVKKDPPKNKTPKPPAKKVDKPKEKKPEPEKKGPTKEELAAAEKKRKLEAEQKAQKAKQQQLLAQAQERIAKIAPSRDKSSSGKIGDISLGAVPTSITSLQIEALPGVDSPVLSDREISYRDELASRLKLLLRLPEYGDVKVKLTLERSGKVAKVVIVSSENAANRKYIEKTLPTLHFPSFGSNFSEADDYTFAITLSNE